MNGFIDTSATTETKSFPRQSDGVIVSGPIIFTQPENGVAATINGLELAYQSRLGFISESLDDFGVLMNYTKISSAAQYSEVGDVRNSGLPACQKVVITSLYTTMLQALMRDCHIHGEMNT